MVAATELEMNCSVGTMGKPEYEAHRDAILFVVEFLVYCVASTH